MRILTGNDEIVEFKEGKQFEVVPHYYNGIFMGYNLMLENDLIDTYDEEEFAVAVMNELCRIIEKEKATAVNIHNLNLLLEAI